MKNGKNGGQSSKSWPTGTPSNGIEIVEAKHISFCKRKPHTLTNFFTVCFPQDADDVSTLWRHGVLYTREHSNQFDTSALELPPVGGYDQRSKFIFDSSCDLFQI